MKQDNKERRKEQIQTAAYALLEENGYKATSMLAIAKRARASNETLYAWYGNKQALFQTLIENNASAVSSTLTAALKAPSDIKTELNLIGPLLLGVVTDEKAIALNRAAAADANETGILGETLANAGRNAIAPLLVKLFKQAQSRHQLGSDKPQEMAEVYLRLLIGDVQIRRATGAMEPLSVAVIRKRSRRATELTLRLFSA